MTDNTRDSKQSSSALPLSARTMVPLESTGRLMKRHLVCAIMIVLCCTSMVRAQCLDGFSLPWIGSQCGDLKVKTSAQVGFQHVGSNISLPVGSELVSGVGDLQIDTLDITLQDANFWTGIMGFTVIAAEKYSFFASAGGNLDREFVTTGTIPVSLNGVGTSASIDFTNSGLRTWFAQTGVGLGPILFGLYWDKFTIKVADPRTANGPLPNQTLRGDFVTTTFCPYVGFALPVSQAMLTVMYSPLAWANTTLALRSSNNGETDLQYKWNKPGSFLSASFQYNQDLSKTTSFGVWTSYTWMNQQGTCGLSFQHNGGIPVTRDREITAMMTKYVLQGGLTLGINF
jgi:hypothetical protein